MGTRLFRAGSGRRSTAVGSVLRIAALLALASTTACDAGFIEVLFVWPGERPSFPESQPVTTFMRAEERSVIEKPGRVLSVAEPHPFTEPRTLIPEIPYGANRVIIAETRESPEADSQVLYYGLSERFSIARGQHVQVPIFMQPTRPPQPAEVEGSLRVITSTGAPGYVNTAEVELILFTDTGVQVRLSNILGLPEEHSVLQPLAELPEVAGAPPGYRGYRMRWNLDRSLPAPCVERDFCARTIFARFIDAQGYASRPVSTNVVLDTAAPSLVRGASTITPDVARADSLIVVSLTASEILARTPTIAVVGFERFGLVRVFPENERASSTFTFTSTRPAGALGIDGELTVVATLQDLAGNRASDLTIGTFEVDRPAPGIRNLTIEPARIGGQPGGEISVDYTLEKESASTVSIGGRPMDNCERTGTAPDLHVACVRAMRGDEIQPDTEVPQAVVVEAVDAAGNASRATGSVVFDFRAPRLVSAGFSSPTARDGAVVSLRVSVDEPLRVLPRLEWAQNRDPGLTFVETLGLTHRFDLHVGASTSERTFTLAAIEVEDEAGNRARVPVNPPAEIQIDRTAPSIHGISVAPARIGRSGTVEARFTLSEPMSDVALGVTLGGRPMRCMAQAADVHCTYAVAGDETAADTEASTPLVIDAVDAAGNAARENRSVIFDFRAPEVVPGSVTLQLVPSPRNLLLRIPGAGARPDAVGFGTTVRLGFSLDEATTAEPTITTAPGILPFRRVAAAGSTYVYAFELAEGAHPQGSHTVDVTAVDAVGNRGTRRLTLPTQLAIDTEPPAAPNTLRILHDRLPWGSEAAGPGPLAFVEGDAGAVEANARVVVLGARNLATFDVLGSVVADGRGGIPRRALDRAEDRPEIYVTVLDGAGNPSASTTGHAGEASRVRRGAWTATLQGKVPESRTPNPHEVQILAWTQPTLAQDEDAAQPFDAAAAAALERTDGDVIHVQGLRRWEEITRSSDQPPPRERAAMAYDSMRGRAVLFGGRDDSGALRDTWEWDGRRWFSIAPQGASPSARSDAAMAFDAARGRVVLFGGQSGTNELADTWVWDGISWTEVTPAGNPVSARSGHVMVYDAARGEVLLFGGEGQNGALGDGYLWDGTTWTPFCTAAARCPPARRDATALYDPSTETVMLYGGSSGGANARVFSNRYVWNGAVWEEMTSFRGSGLPQRAGANLGFDEARSAWVIFGGAYGTSFAQDVRVNGQLLTLPGAEDQPEARAFASMFFDLRRGQLILFGGRGATGLFADTWAWEGEHWRNITPSGEVPVARESHAMTYDATERRTILFGGRDGTTLLGDTWAWNGARWDRLIPSLSPPSTQRHAMSEYDGHAVIFGGHDGTHARNTLWKWNGSGWNIAARNPGAVHPGAEDFDFPSERQSPAVAWDVDRRRLVLFGGASSGDMAVGETWEFDALRWTSYVAPGSAQPSPRKSHAMAYDRAHRRTLLFGGIDSSGQTIADFWAWDGTRWTELHPGGATPEARSGHGLVYDDSRNRIMLLGGVQPGPTAINDVWEWDGSTWSRLSFGRTTPVGQFGGAVAYDHDRRSIVVAGTSASSDVWELHWNPEQRPGLKIDFDEGQLGIASRLLDTMTLETAAGGRGFEPSSGRQVVGAQIFIWGARTGRWIPSGVFWNDTGALSLHSLSLPPTRSFADIITPEEQIHFLIQPGAGGGVATDTAELSLDAIELRATYTQPD